MPKTPILSEKPARTTRAQVGEARASARIAVSIGLIPLGAPTRIRRAPRALEPPISKLRGLPRGDALASDLSSGPSASLFNANAPSGPPDSPLLRGAARRTAARN